MSQPLVRPLVGFKTVAFLSLWHFFATTRTWTVGRNRPCLTVRETKEIDKAKTTADAYVARVSHRQIAFRIKDGSFHLNSFSPASGEICQQISKHATAFNSNIRPPCASASACRSLEAAGFTGGSTTVVCRCLG